MAQIALNWLLRKPTVSTLVIGARNEEQLMQNLGAEGWRLTPEQVAKLDEASKSAVLYPYWHHRQSQDRARCRHLSANKPSFLRPVIRPQLSDSKHLFKNLFNVRRDAAK